MANLNAKEMFDEVFERDLIQSVEGNPTKKNLTDALKKDMAGLARPPAMTFGDVKESMSQLNLEFYEVTI